MGVTCGRVEVMMVTRTEAEDADTAVDGSCRETACQSQHIRVRRVSAK